MIAGGASSIGLDSGEASTEGDASIGCSSRAGVSVGEGSIDSSGVGSTSAGVGSDSGSTDGSVESLERGVRIDSGSGEGCSGAKSDCREEDSTAKTAAAPTKASTSSPQNKPVCQGLR